jgi:hypothetical protein
MRISKDGKLKLSKDERQYGNFVFKNEVEYVKICDINSNLTHRVSKSLNIGQMMAIALKEKQTIWLENYAALVWTFSNIVTDEQFFLDIDRVCGECINRHPELYGIEPNISAEEDAKILQESKEVHEAIEELKKEK